MTRVMIIGNAGGGKSTLARRLSRMLRLPLFAVDRMQWSPGWQPVPRDEVARCHGAVLQRDRWILDGWGPWDLIEERLSRCDTVILVDRPLWQHYWWASKRQIVGLFRPRVDGPKGCPMLPVTLRLFRMMRTIHRDLMPRLRELVSDRHRGKEVIVIRSQADQSRLMARAARGAG